MWFPRQTRATAMGVKQTGVPAGGVVAALIAATGQEDWRALAVGMAVVTMIAGAGYLKLRVAPQPAASAVRFSDIRVLLRQPRLALFNVGVMSLFRGASGVLRLFCAVRARRNGSVARARQRVSCICACGVGDRARLLGRSATGWFATGGSFVWSAPASWRPSVSCSC